MRDNSGPEVILGMLGCYLVVSAIVGKLIRIRSIVTDVKLGSSGQRVLLGVFGLILAGPVIWSTYGHLVFGTKGALVAPTIEEKVAVQPEASIARDRVPLNVSWVQDSAEVCPVLESFGLEQRNVRQLKSALFEGRVYAYAEDVHSVPRKPFNVWVFIPSTGSWPSSGKQNEDSFIQKLSSLPTENVFRLNVRQQGQAVAFRYGGKSYRLTVTKIYAVLFGSDKIAIEVCGPLNTTSS